MGPVGTDLWSAFVHPGVELVKVNIEHRMCLFLYRFLFIFRSISVDENGDEKG